MDRLMRIAIFDVLIRTRVVLVDLYGGVVANGRRCPSCRAEGWGRPAEHMQDCAGVKLLRDTEAAISTLNE